MANRASPALNVLALIAFNIKKMECWRAGVLEWWGPGPHSNTPSLHRPVASQQMPQLLPLGLEVARVVRVGFHLYRQLLDDLQPVAFQPHNLPRIIRQQPDGLEAQVRQNLRPEAVLAQVHVVS